LVRDVDDVGREELEQAVNGGKEYEVREYR
jgi:hypothetical protein